MAGRRQRLAQDRGGSANPARCAARPPRPFPPAPEIRFAHDSALEGGGFEPSVPRQKDLCKRSPATASTGGAQLNPGVRFFGHWLEYNEPAARDAKQKLRAFLAANLDGVAAGQSQTPP